MSLVDCEGGLLQALLSCRQSVVIVITRNGTIMSALTRAGKYDGGEMRIEGVTSQCVDSQPGRVAEQSKTETEPKP